MQCTSRKEGERCLTGKLFIRKGMEQTLGRLKKLALALTGLSDRLKMSWQRS